MASNDWYEKNVLFFWPDLTAVDKNLWCKKLSNLAGDCALFVASSNCLDKVDCDGNFDFVCKSKI